MLKFIDISTNIQYLYVLMVIFTIILIINIIHEKYVIKKLKEKVDFQKKVEKELNEIFEKLK